jgi:streptogramin lyase
MSKTPVSIVRALLPTWLAAVLVLAGGCDCGSPPTTTCRSSADCDPGEVCVDMRCVSRGDSGGVDASGPDTGVACADLDSDGHIVQRAECPGGDDCDDSNPAVHGGQPELCGDGIDNDCDGETDEADCGCVPGEPVTCYSGPAGTSGVGRCRPGAAECAADGTVGACAGEIVPSAEDGPEDCNSQDDDCDGTTDEGLLDACGRCSTGPLVEICGDDTDNDCDGMTDEDCTCAPGRTLFCYTGAVGTAGMGACRAGIAVCDAAGMPGACRGERLPVAEDSVEECNGLDDDCDGRIDEGLRDACGACSTAPLTEVCANGLDDDCDGLTDEDCDCDFRCVCDPMTSCECTPPTNQPCYEGPFDTEGRGVCRGGRRDCALVGTEARWQACMGQILPGAECAGGTANGADDDCDGLVDEGCLDADRDGSPWPDDCDDSDAAIHPGATETCNERDDNCNHVTDEGVTNRCGTCGAVPMETCGDGRDDDCDGLPDDGCTCTGGATQDCFLGPAGTEGVGRCRAGRQTCAAMSEFATWGACTGAVGPIPEVCNGEDDDCDGDVDERWATGSNACGYCGGVEVCNDADDDCDGLVDEGVANRCGTCGAAPTEVCNDADDDCDGVVDEGTTNACGTCAPTPCFTETWDRPADCTTPGRTCDGVVEDRDHPGAITLGEGTLSYDYLYVALTNRGEVAQLDTTTGAVNWTRSSHGQNPSRTAVAFDGSVWVGNRGFVDPTNIAVSNLVHLDTDGNLICRAATVTGLVRGVAIDADGNVWAGAFDGREVFRVSGTEVDRTTSPPTCRLLSRHYVGFNVYGLAVDPDGYVWTSSSPTIRVRVSDGAQTPISNSHYYGIAADGAGRMWFGGWNPGTGPLHYIDRTTLTQTNVTLTDPVTAVTVHPDGSVWATAYNAGRIIAYDPVLGRERCSTLIPVGTGSNPHGIAVDRAGRVWAPNRYGGFVNVYDPTTCVPIASYVVARDEEIYSYSDMTGHLLRTFTAPEGHWTQVFDSGYASASWNEASWVADVPAGSAVEVTVRASDSPTDFSGSAPCGPFTSTPADLTACGLGRHRYLQLDVTLRSTAGGARPIVYRVDARWAY